MLEIVEMKTRYTDADEEVAELAKLTDRQPHSLLGVGLRIGALAAENHFVSLGELSSEANRSGQTAARAAEVYELPEFPVTIVVPAGATLDEAMAVYLLMVRWQFADSSENDAMPNVDRDPRNDPDALRRMDDVFQAIEWSPPWYNGRDLEGGRDTFRSVFAAERALDLYRACLDPQLHVIAKTAMVRMYIEQGDFVVPRFSDSSVEDVDD